MAIDVKILAMANLAVQITLIIIVSVAVYLARKKRFTRHCTVMRVAVPVEIIATLLVMLPSFLGYIENVPSLPLFYPELLIHHGLGLALIILWIYINLGITQIVRMPRNRAAVMRLALTVWIATLILGLDIYYRIYV